MVADWRPRLERGEVPIFQALADALVADVASGKLPPGKRLPTHRDLADVLGTSVGTVTRAYREAEARGAIEAAPGRGTFVRRLPDGWPAAGMGMAMGLSLIDLSIAHPQYAQDPDLVSALRSVADHTDVQRLLRYQTLSEHPRYRDAAMQWLQECGVSAEPGAVVITAGAQHAAFALLSILTRPGDLVVVDELTYPGLFSAAELSGRPVRGVPMDRHGMIPEALREVCERHQPKLLYLIPTLHNPTGILMPKQRRAELAEIAEEHDLVVIEDDTLRLLMPEPPSPVTSLIPRRSFFIASMSKSVAGGLRVAFVASPPAMTSALEAAVGATVFMVSPLSLDIAAGWIADGTAKHTVARKRSEIAARHSLARAVFSGDAFLSHPQSYYFWLQLPGWNSSEFAAEARRQGVVVTPSRPFAVTPTDPPSAVRICLSAAETREQLEVALHRLRHLAERPGGRTPGVV